MQEFLVNLDPVWDERLTRCCIELREALTENRYRRRSSAASVGAGLATGGGRPVRPLYRPTQVFEMQQLP